MRRSKKPAMLMEKQQMNSRRKQCTEISQIPKQVRQDKIRFSWFVICLMILHFLYSDCPQEVHMWLEMKAKCEPMLLKQKTSFIPENPEAKCGSGVQGKRKSQSTVYLYTNQVFMPAVTISRFIMFCIL